jgi:hypothetical protein
MNDIDLILKLLPVLIPVFILEVLLMIVGLVDLVRNEKLNKSQKIVWAIVIVIIQILGPVVYLVVSNLQRKGADD